MNLPAVPPSTHSTDSLALAGYLVSRDFDVRVTALGRGLCRFTFDDSQELQASIAAYSDGTARVSPRKLDNAHALLRRRMKAAQAEAHRSGDAQ